MTDAPDRYSHPKHDLETVLKAVEKGITASGAARLLRVTRQTMMRYRRKWKAVDEAILAKRRELVDLAEMGLRKAVLEGEPWAVTFALRTLGKDEGYSERHEVTGANGGPVQTTITEMVVQLPPEDSEGE
jgi:hypothetical protein